MTQQEKERRIKNALEDLRALSSRLETAPKTRRERQESGKANRSWIFKSIIKRLNIF